MARTERKTYRFSLNLQTFSDPGVEIVPEAGEQVEQPEQAEQAEQTEQPTEKKEDVAWAKRIAAEREKIRKEADAEWQSKLEEERSKYKGHDDYKKVAEYLQKTSGINDIMTLKEQIELEELQERAEQENVPPSVLKRIDELEAKAKEADELKAQVEQAKQAEQFETTLKTYCEGKELDGKPLDHKELWKYMADNEVSNPDIAYKAMKADLLEAQVAEAKKKGVEEYLASKTGVKTNSGAAVSSIPSGGGFKGASERALARMRAAKNN